MAYRGATGLRRDSAGALQIATALGELRDSPPVAFTIQIDDSQSFSAPLIVGETIAFSQLTTNSLPTTRMWWRVRANDGSGAPGPWSGARRFEVRN